MVLQGYFSDESPRVSADAFKAKTYTNGYGVRELQGKIHPRRSKIVNECKGQRVRKKTQIGSELSGRRPSASNFARLYKPKKTYIYQAFDVAECARREAMAAIAKHKSRQDFTVFDNILFHPYKGKL